MLILQRRQLRGRVQRWLAPPTWLLTVDFGEVPFWYNNLNIGASIDTVRPVALIR